MCLGRPQRAQESGKRGEQEDWIRQALGGHLKDVTFVLSKMGNWGIFLEEGDDLIYCFFQEDHSRCCDANTLKEEKAKADWVGSAAATRTNASEGGEKGWGAWRELEGGIC